MNENQKYSVMVVDDEVHNIDMLCQILRPMYTVKTAKNGQMAIKMAEKHLPDLILLDVVMPDMSGFDVLAHLKESDMTRGIPVIIVTGLESSHYEEKGLRLGAVDYIVKPFNNSVVKLRVKTHLKIIEQMRIIERLGMIDALTDVPNRRGFDHQLYVEWGRGIREKAYIGFLMIDIDRFKSFNDNYGHAHGDVVLKSVARVISETLKRPADFVARWGGEEFAVLLPQTDMRGSYNVAEEIRSNIERMHVLCENGKDTNVTVSIGINAVIPDTDSGLGQFVTDADKALYNAKQAGRNVVRSV